VVIGENISEWRDVLSGDPQGSVLGPLLFLIYINDMPSLTQHFCKLFADDTKLIATIKKLGDRDLLQSDINRLTDWATRWKMCFNEDKCKVMIFDKRKHNQMNTAFIEDVDSFSGFTMTDQLGIVHDLKETEVERDLGIMINNKLRWADQISHAKSKAYSILGTLKRTFVCWNSYSFRILYTTYVRPPS